MEQIEQRKEKAAELSSGRHANTDYAPKLTPYERKKQCSLCSVVVCAGSSHPSLGWLMPFGVAYSTVYSESSFFCTSGFVEDL